MSESYEHSVELGRLSPFYERFAYTPTSFKADKFPENFPINQWDLQATRYAELNRWFTGDALAETKRGKEGEILSQYPLHMNSLRAFVRKHAAVLFGEVPDGASPLAKIIVRPRKRFDGKPILEKDKQTAEMLESIVSEVMTRSNARAMMLENGKFSQYLGGSVFECSYEPDRKDLLIPLVIRNPRPDFFLPEWSNENYWNLLRGTTIYQIPAPIAKMQYGIGDGEPGEVAIYTREFTADHYAVKVDGEPVKFNDKKLQEGANPFEITPSIYIPHVREGSHYGSSHVEDVASLLKEFNGRMADLGTAVLDTTKRPTYISNVYGDKVTTVITDDGTKLTSLGVTPPASGSKDAPSVHEGTPPPISQYMLEYANMIWRQMLRECDMSGIPFGEDEGSQRSGATLALRMWPLLAHTREERTHWNDGLSRLGYIILTMAKKVQDQLLRETMKALGISIPDNWEQLVEISVEWAPQIPQDRAQQVLELTQLKPAGLISTEEAITQLGDVKDVDVELDKIKADQKFAADLAAQQNQPFGGGASTGSPKPSSNGTQSNGTPAKASSATSSAN